MDVFLNDSIIDRAEASVPVTDAGFQHAVGLFETMAARHGEVFRLDAHLDRLIGSARDLGLARSLDRPPLADAVGRALAANEADRARVRLTLTGGSLSLLRGSDDDEKAGPTVLVEVTEPIDYDPKFFEEGVMVMVGPAAANPFDPMAGHKTLAYWGRLRSLREAAAAGAGETLWLNVSNHLASGAVSNLFLVRNGALLTPFARGEEAEGALPAPVLPGITRAAVIELAEAIGLPVERRMLSVADLLEADEAFLTNSGWQVLPVTKVEKATVGTGRAGEITTDLRERLLATIDAETAGRADGDTGGGD